MYSVGCQKRLRWKSGAIFLIWILLLGAFNNCVVRISSFFEPLPLPSWTVFMPWAWTKADIFCPPPPINLVHVVIEWPHLILTKVDKQAAAIASPSPFWLMVPCDPALKAINPKIKMKPPRDMCGMEWPEMNILSLSLKRSMRGPRIIAPERRRHHSFNSIHHLVSFSVVQGYDWISPLLLLFFQPITIQPCSWKCCHHGWKIYERSEFRDTTVRWNKLRCSRL